jgi:hypothetical protein
MKTLPNYLAQSETCCSSIYNTYIKAHKPSAGVAKKGNAIPKANAKMIVSE